MPVTAYVERAVRSVHQIELSSLCSLRCTYCPSPAIVAGKMLDRAAVDMSRVDFERTLAHVERYVRAGTQDGELNLAGIGESCLHPDLPAFIRLARKSLDVASPGTRSVVMATNGTHFTEEIAAAFAECRPGGVWVSMHRPEVAGPATEIARRHGVLLAATMDPVLRPNSWAGQINNAWAKKVLPTGTRYDFRCDWLADGRVFVLADGRVSACCLDATGGGTFAHVSDDDLGRTRSWSLCGGCHHSLPRYDLDQIQATGGLVRIGGAQ